MVQSQKNLETLQPFLVCKYTSLISIFNYVSQSLFFCFLSIFNFLEHLVFSVLEYNQLSGKIPPELGNLPNLKRLYEYLFQFLPNCSFFLLLTISYWSLLAGVETMFTLFRLLSSNNLSGEIPSTFAKLTTLTDL